MSLALYGIAKTVFTRGYGMGTLEQLIIGD